MGDVTENFACAPILLIGFNRPDFMTQQIEVLKSIRPSKVYVAVDGPRDNVDGESRLCNGVRDCVRLIDWECNVKTLFREKNRGCKYGVSEAISWFFENEPEGIILEDDCRPDLSFFRFATELLERYRDDIRIGAISSMNLYDWQSDKEVSYHFNTHINIWGWATWRRVWKNYTVDILKYTNEKDLIVNRGLFTSRARRAALKSFNAVANGLNTWDYQLGFMFMSLGLLTITPKVKLVGNVGFADGRGTNVVGYNFDAHYLLKRGSMVFPLIHPTSVFPDVNKIREEERREYGLIPRALTFIGCKVPAMIRYLNALGVFGEHSVPWLFKV